MNIQELIEQKFRSGNGVDVGSVRISRAEWEAAQPVAVPEGFVPVPVGLLTLDDCLRFGMDARALRSLSAAPKSEQQEGAGQAIATLKRMGYTYHGGELWKPPLGQRPAWLDEQQEAPDAWKEVCRLYDGMKASAAERFLDCLGITEPLESWLSMTLPEIITADRAKRGGA